jgi:hypothetical protein
MQDLPIHEITLEGDTVPSNPNHFYLNHVVRNHTQLQLNLIALVANQYRDETSLAICLDYMREAIKYHAWMPHQIKDEQLNDFVTMVSNTLRDKLKEESWDRDSIAISVFGNTWVIVPFSILHNGDIAVYLYMNWQDMIDRLDLARQVKAY